MALGRVVLVSLLVVIPLSIAYLKLSIFSNIQSKPKVVALNRTVDQIRQENHPSLYYFDLKYDPKSNQALKSGSGEFHGDLPLFLSRPSSDSAVFNHKIETISLKGNILFSGWQSLYKTVIEDPDGKYSFRIVVPYVSGGTVIVYSVKNEKLWEGKVN